MSGFGLIVQKAIFAALTGQVGTGVGVAGSISSSSDQDYFYFDVSTSGNINISLAIGSSADLDWFLYNSSLTEVARGSSTANPEVGNYNAAPGRSPMRWLAGAAVVLPLLVVAALFATPVLGGQAVAVGMMLLAVSPVGTVGAVVSAAARVVKPTAAFALALPAASMALTVTV